MITDRRNRSISKTPDINASFSRHIFSTEDARHRARRRQPKVVFDFIEGGVGREMALSRNLSCFDKITLQPRVMENVKDRRLKKSFLGQDFDLPFGIAPMGMCNLSWPRADRAIAVAANLFNIPVCLSSSASSSIEDMRDWAGENAWFQLYVRDPVEQAFDMVERARVAGYRNLVLTVDVPEISRRVRDLRNGFAIPIRIGSKLFWDFATHPRWSLSTLWYGAPEPKNFASGQNDIRFDRSASRAGADWDFLDQLRAKWGGKLIVKGVTSAQDALRTKAAGVDAVYVSNHGGRQLDSAPATIDLLPAIRNAVGPDYPLLFDSGIRNGEDIVKALAMGADFVMIGRPALYALGADGSGGLNALINIISDETSLTLAQTGLNDIAAISTSILHGDETGPENDKLTLIKSDTQ